MKLELNHKKKFERISSTSRLRTILLKDGRVNQEIREQFKTFMQSNEKNMQPRILYPARLSFKMEGVIKSSKIGRTERICDHQTSSARNFKRDY